MTRPTEKIWRALRQDVERVQRRVDRLSVKTQRSETAGGVPASTLANAPRAADGGMSDGTNYIDLLWISDGRKPGEDANVGTGVLAVYSATTDSWLRIGDYTPVET